MKNISSQKKQNSKNFKEKKHINPFEVHINRSKFNILGQKSKDDRGLPGVSRAKAFKKREKTLLHEYKDRHKDTKFVDKRIGENNPYLDPERKMMLRLIAEKKKQIKNSDQMLNDEELFHGGKSLNENTMRDSIGFSDDDDDDDLIDANYVKEQHFGGDLFSKPKTKDGNKSKKERIDEMIAESKKKKAETKMEKGIHQNAVAELDSKFSNFMKAMRKHLMTDDEKDNSKKTCEYREYDTLVRTILFDRSGKANPSDRLKDPEEIAKEEKEKLQRLEDERERRMLGHVNTSCKSQRSADALDDGWVLDIREPTVDEEEFNDTKSRKTKVKVKINEEKKESEKESDTSDEEDETEGESDDEEEGDSLHDGNENCLKIEENEDLEEIEKDDEISDDEYVADEGAEDIGTSDDEYVADEGAEDIGTSDDEVELKDDDEASVEVEQESEINNSEDELEDEDKESVEGESEPEVVMIEDEEKLEVEEEQEMEDVEKHKKKKTKLTPLISTTEEKIHKSPLNGKLKTSEKTEELPYTFEVPEEYDSFWGLLENRTPDEVSTIIERMIACNHPSLGADNKTKSNTIFTYILQTLHSICSVDPDLIRKNTHSLSYVNSMIPHLYTITQFNPNDCATALTEVIDEKYEEYTSQKPRRYPNIDTFIFLKISGLLFPASDFHHDVMTRVLTFLTQMLKEAKVECGRDIISLQFTASLLSEYLKRSRRFVGELMNALNGILFLSIPKTSLNEKLPINAPFKGYGPTSELLVLSKKFKSCNDLPKLTLSLINEEVNISKSFKCRVVNEALSSLCTLCTTWTNLSSIRVLFHTTKKLLERIPVENYPDSVTISMQNLKMAISNLPKQPPPLKKDETIVKTLKMLQPSIEEVYEGMKKRNDNKDYQEKEKLLHKLRRERKGAKREIKRDTQFLARQQLKEILESDAERKRKVNLIMQGLSMQENEFKKFKSK